MLTFNTKRLIAQTNMIIDEGELCFHKKNFGTDLLSLQPNNAQNGAIVFYLQNDPNMEVCKIAVEFKRKPYELIFETINAFRNQGYMSEALAACIEWLFTCTKCQEIYLLINDNPISKYIATKTGFMPIQSDDHGNWFIIKKCFRTTNSPD